ncbi:MAG: prephenate dehydrogenase [Chloroflexi bacterium]|nr:prephenate dehydrogenase [Chloroflexota bacterium]
MSDLLSGLHVHIVGLGLMGGSMALSLKGKVKRLTGYDTDAQVVEAAIAQGMIDSATGDSGELVIVAVPADRIPEVVAGLSLADGAVVIDLGSTKGAICDALDKLPVNIAAVGGHPMCGLAENGFSNAIPTLYRGARFVLCETARTTPYARQVAEALVVACGAVPLWMDRLRHDYLTALTSHLPHLLSFALMRLAAEIAAEEADVFQLAAGGFDGATRLARTDAAMITGMFTTNQANLRRLAEALRQHLALLDSLLETPEALALELDQIVRARRDYSTQYGERPIA